VRAHYVIDKSREHLEEVFIKTVDGGFIYLQKRVREGKEVCKLYYCSRLKLPGLLEYGLESDEFEREELDDELDLVRIASSYVKHFHDMSNLSTIDIPDELMYYFKMEDLFELKLFHESEDILNQVIERNIAYTDSLLKISELASEIIEFPPHSEITDKLFELLNMDSQKET
jgi:hypothetical protein